MTCTLPGQATTCSPPHDDVDEALRLYRKCADTGTWPGLADDQQNHTLTDTPWIDPNEQEEVIYG